MHTLCQTSQRLKGAGADTSTLCLPRNNDITLFEAWHPVEDEDLRNVSYLEFLGRKDRSVKCDDRKLSLRNVNCLQCSFGETIDSLPIFVSKRSES